MTPQWIAFNVETGDEFDRNFRSWRTQFVPNATSKMVEGEGRFRVRCQGAWGHLSPYDWRKDVNSETIVECRRCLTDTGHALWLDRNVGCIHSERLPNFDRCVRDLE